MSDNGCHPTFDGVPSLRQVFASSAIVNSVRQYARAAVIVRSGLTKRVGMRSNEPELRTLMLAGLDGDPSAHKQLLSKLSGYLRAYFKNQLIRVGRSPADAEDLVQETLIAIHTRRHTYDRSQLLTPWVQAVARYRLIDYLRRSKASVADVPIEEAEDVLNNIDSSAVDSGLDLETLLARLTPKTRQAIRLVKLDGLSVSEAAARSGMSESAIKVSVHRGLKALSLLVRQRSRS
jgi:RNA polymerase sigma-70 factor (ECF subfamily)